MRSRDDHHTHGGHQMIPLFTSASFLVIQVEVTAWSVEIEDKLIKDLKIFVG